MILLTPDNQGQGVFIHPKVITDGQTIRVVDRETGLPIKVCGCTGHHWIVQLNPETGQVKLALTVEGMRLEE